jgi:tRNA(Ile)-lysidine synthase
MPPVASDPLTAALRRLHAAHRADAYAVAYSGGLDSHCLLHAAAALRLPKLRALHVQHGLHAAAEDWLRHCRRESRALAVPFRALRLNLPRRPAQGIEAAARSARYAAFAAELRTAECLLLAQHQDDQAETFLLQALRGAGVEGLAAMAETAALGRGCLARPFLPLPRDELRRYAGQHGLRWVEDDSNADTRFDRNFLRAEIMPRLRRRWPGTDATLARAARHNAGAAEALRAAALAALEQLRGDLPGTLNASALAALPVALQAPVLRAWLRERGLPLPDENRLRAAAALPALRADANPCVRWPGAELRRYRQSLHAMPPLPPAPHQPVAWSTRRPLLLMESGLMLHLRARPPRSPPGNAPGKVLALNAAALTGTSLSIRFRSGGERLRPAGEGMSRSLKHLLQDWGLPPWQRERWPLLYAGEMLAAVAGYAVMEGFAALPGRPVKYLWLEAT